MSDTATAVPGYARKLLDELIRLEETGAGRLGIMKTNRSGFILWQAATLDRGGRWSLNATSPHSNSAGVWLIEHGFARLDGEILRRVSRAHGA